MNSACPRSSLEKLVLGELDVASMAEVHTHLRRCEGCARELDRLRALREALRRRAADTDLPLLGVRARVEAALTEKRRRRRLLRQEGPMIAALASAALLIGVSISLTAPHPNEGVYSSGPIYVEDPFAEEAILDQYGVWKRDRRGGACELAVSLPPPDDGRNACM